jgi:hypothetical protein
MLQHGLDQSTGGAVPFHNCDQTVGYRDHRRTLRWPDTDVNIIVSSRRHREKADIPHLMCVRV